MRVTQELNNVIAAAYSEAKARSHEYVTPEHILYASLFFDGGSKIITACGGDIKRLKKEQQRNPPQTYCLLPCPWGAWGLKMVSSLLATKSINRNLNFMI